MDNALDAIYWRDEILQIMYWFRGEELGEVVSPRDLVPFLGAEETFVQQQLERLVEEGYVARQASSTPDGTMRYQLTDWGVTEAGRRFADEFEGLTGQAHGECNNPNCSCQTLGPEACAGHTPHVH